MNKVVTCSIHLLLIASMLLLTACPKRPNRPNPDQTLSGMGPGELEFGMVGDAGGGDDLYFDSASGLQDRGAGLGGPGNQIRDLLQPVFFEFDRATIGPNERDKAMAAADYLRSNPRHRLLIEGHCDWRGTTEYNLGLGDRRAGAVKDFLVSIGVDGGRVEVLSKGDLEASQGGSEQEMARDRRAELVVLQE